MSESSSESFAMLIFVSSSCAEKVRVMMICGVDLLGTMTTPGVWVPEQVGSSRFSENSLDKLCILIFTTISHRPNIISLALAQTVIWLPLNVLLVFPAVIWMLCLLMFILMCYCVIFGISQW